MSITSTEISLDIGSPSFRCVSDKPKIIENLRYARRWAVLSDSRLSTPIRQNAAADEGDGWLIKRSLARCGLDANNKLGANLANWLQFHIFHKPFDWRRVAQGREREIVMEVVQGMPLDVRRADEHE